MASSPALHPGLPAGAQQIEPRGVRLIRFTVQWPSRTFLNSDRVGALANPTNRALQFRSFAFAREALPMPQRNGWRPPSDADRIECKYSRNAGELVGEITKTLQHLRTRGVLARVVYAADFEIETPGRK